jgi:hypothetical protein
MKQQLYYPSTIAKQILWLAQFRRGFPEVAAKLEIAPKDIADTLNDIDWMLHGLSGLRAPLVHLTKAVTAYNKTLQTGKGPEVMLPPPLIFPEAPTTTPPRPGALKRLFNMVQRLKASRGYIKAMGMELGIESNLFPEADAPAPTFTLKLLSSSVCRRCWPRRRSHDHSSALRGRCSQQQA